jgi:hypothetical protein
MNQMGRPKQSRACSLQDLRPDFAKVVQKHISVDEEIIACYETTGTKSNNGVIFETQTPVYSAQIISRKQLILGWSSNDGYSVKSIQLRDIVSISEGGSGGVYGYWVTASAQGEIHLGCAFANPQMSQDFAQILKQAIEQEKTASESKGLSLASIEERIETLTRLHKNGLISDLEFQEKRKELLNQI